MDRKLKILAAFFTVLMCFSVFTLSAFAVDDVIGGDDTPVVDVPTDPAPAPEPDPVYTDPITPSDDEPSYVEPTYYNDNSSSQYYDDSSSDNNSYNSYSYDSSSDSNAGGVQSSYAEPGSTAPSAALYDTDKNIDENVLSNNDWNDIAANLKNAASSDNDSDDFSFIKDNNSTGDNGEWMLIVGIICLILSIAGIAYVITSTVMQKKKLKSSVSGHGKSKGKHPATATAGASYRSNDDYGDSYKRSQKEERKQTEKKRRYDTAEVKLPKGSQNGSRYKGSNGRRYK